MISSYCPGRPPQQPPRLVSVTHTILAQKIYLGQKTCVSDVDDFRKKYEVLRFWPMQSVLAAYFVHKQEWNTSGGYILCVRKM